MSGPTTIESTTVALREGRPWPELLALLGLTIAFAVAAGPLGALAGVATALLWYGLGTPYAIAGGHVLLAALFAEGIDPLSFALVESGVLALVLAPAVRARDPLASVGGTIATLLALSLPAWALVDSQPLWLVAALLLGTIGFLAYGLHRYELVRLGLVEASEPRATSGDRRPARESIETDGGDRRRSIDEATATRDRTPTRSSANRTGDDR